MFKMPEAVASYVDQVLRARPDERAVLEIDTAILPRITD